MIGKLMQTATATIAIILLSGCSPKNFFNGGVYYKEAQIVERKVPVKCNVKKCEEPIDMKLLANTIDNEGESYTDRAIALRLYRPMLEAYNQCLTTQLQICAEDNNVTEKKGN